MTHKLYTGVKQHILVDRHDPARDPAFASVE